MKDGPTYGASLSDPTIEFLIGSIRAFTQVLPVSCYESMKSRMPGRRGGA